MNDVMLMWEEGPHIVDAQDGKELFLQGGKNILGHVF